MNALMTPPAGTLVGLLVVTAVILLAVILTISERNGRR